MQNQENMGLIKLIIAIICPPLAVALHVGLSIHFWINLILTFLGYFPGVLHAIYVIMCERD